MTSHLNTIRVLEWTSLDRALKPSDATVKAARSTKGVAEHATENDDASSTALTLDDFGGRSDALGG
jgi:hypothetical protein